jgi:hypothetical protein
MNGELCCILIAINLNHKLLTTELLYVTQHQLQSCPTFWDDVSYGADGCRRRRVTSNKFYLVALWSTEQKWDLNVLEESYNGNMQAWEINDNKFKLKVEVSLCIIS